MLTINAPICRPDDVEPLVRAGADCFYCGLADSDDPFDVATRNGRQFPGASFRTSADFERAVAAAHALGTTVAFAANARQYEPGTFDRQRRQLGIALDAGVDRVIVGNVPLLEAALDVFRPEQVVASVFLGIMNSGACEFFRAFGVRTVVLPRPLRPEETVALAKRFPDIDFEVLVLNDRCVNIDAFCGHSHFEIEGIRPGHSFCRIDRGPGFACTLLDACGACELRTYRQAGNVRYLKVAGRGVPHESLARDVGFLRAAIRALDDDPGPEDYGDRVRNLYEEFHGRPCGRVCYR